MLICINSLSSPTKGKNWRTGFPSLSHIDAFCLIIFLLFYSFIDLVKVIDVNAVEKARQDKNNGSFNINCEGRVFELLAHDESEMTR